jgi:hypothetical protein
MLGPMMSCHTLYRLSSLWPHLLMLAALTWLGACDDDAIRNYSAPKDPPKASQPTRPTVPPPGAVAPGTQATWVKPPDWRVDPQGTSFAMASFLAGPEDAANPVRITLTRFGSDGGGLLPNINRWRGQLNLAPIAKLEDENAAPVSLDGVVGVLVDLAAEGAYGSDPERAVGVMAFRRTDSWFVKMTGPSSAVEQARPAFDAFVASVRLPQESATQ